MTPLTSAEQITIAITVYSRRDYIADAISSALNQTVAAKVIVVEDCGPDASLREFVRSQFGERVEYFRNDRNRGLFDNWNACMEYCTTPWLSILHDDDLLQPHFVETMLGLAKKAPAAGIYFGTAQTFRTGDRELDTAAPAGQAGWRRLDLPVLAERCSLLFPGQLFNVAEALAAGGVRKHSFFTGDWDLWFRLALRSAAVQTEARLARVRSHDGDDRGTNRVERMGWKWALDNLQARRNLLALSKALGTGFKFDRTKLLTEHPIPLRLLVRHATTFSKRILAYNHALFIASTPPHFPYAAAQLFLRMTGPKGIQAMAAVARAARVRV